MKMDGWRQRRRFTGALIVIVAALAAPSPAAAHGPVDPPASSYLAKVARVPPGVTVKVIDGDQRLWMRVDPRRTVEVLDYQGAPYLRFDRAGVQVNEASAMYYLNQVPAQLPPLHTGPGVRPRWSPVSGGHAYGWHDGRLHALATTALAPGARDLGTWSVRLRVDGAPGAIGAACTTPPAPRSSGSGRSWLRWRACWRRGACAGPSSTSGSPGVWRPPRWRGSPSP